jgi:hypothetical protein
MAQWCGVVAAEADCGWAHTRGRLGLESHARTDDTWATMASAGRGLARLRPAGFATAAGAASRLLGEKGRRAAGQWANAVP